MKKRIALPVIVVLAIGIIASGYFLRQQTDNLGAAQTEIIAIEANVSTLETNLANSEATVSTLEANIEEANASNDKLKADVATQRVINSSLSEELRMVKDPKHFASLQELVDWVDQDDTDTAYASKSLTEKAFILQVRALRDGYLLPAHFANTDYDYYVEYAGNLAYIGDKIYHVDPASDDIFLWGYVNPVPSHPLPLN